MDLILLRHTRPRIGLDICYGATDLDLADDFDVSAASILSELPSIGEIVSSPLRRCRLLAARIARARNAPMRVDERIAEMNFGAWEGQRWDAIPRAELDAWAADFLNARPHGGESVASLRDRVQDALRDTPSDDPPPLWVTHAGVVRAVCAVGGLAEGWETRLDFGCWMHASV